MADNLTVHEIHALDHKFNLADAHTHQAQSPTQQAIVDSLPALWLEAERIPQSYWDHRFIDAFFAAQGLVGAVELQRTQLTYSSSVSFVLVATLFVQLKKSVALIEPCFDNLPDLLQRNGLQLEPIPELLLQGDVYDNLCRHVQSDVIFLVDPNNPTGFSTVQSEEAFGQLVQYCVDHQKWLVIDLCFAPFIQVAETKRRPDLYQYLEEANISYILIEDTGKIFPIQDAKCSLVTASKDLYPLLYEIRTEVLLNVSPFILNLLIHYLEDARQTHFAAAKEIVYGNRTILENALEATPLSCLSASTPISVALIQIPDKDLCTRLFLYWQQNGLYVLPGRYFYWHTLAGESHCRIALARTPDYFQQAMAHLTHLTQKYLHENKIL